MSVRLLAEITSEALARTVWPSSVRMDVYSISDMALAFQRSCMGDCCSTNCSPNLPLSQGPDKSLEAPKKKEETHADLPFFCFLSLKSFYL